MSLQQRFEGKISPEPNSGCWLWTAALSKKGYAVIQTGRKSEPLLYAHRLSYEMFRGPIPSKLQIDHLCRVRSCVNPHHLELVTMRENLNRGIRPHSRKTHCPQGHPYSGENLLITKGRSRICKTCKRKTRNAWRRKIVAAIIFMFSFSNVEAQTIRPTRLSQIQFTELTTAQEGSMTLAEGSFWFNTDLNCVRLRLSASTVCIAEAGGAASGAVLLDPTAAQAILDFNLSTPILNNVRVVDGNKFTTVQAAIDDLPADGGTVFIPQGDITFAGPIIIGASATGKCVRLVGAGTGGPNHTLSQHVTRLINSADADAIQVVSRGCVVIENLTIDDSAGSRTQGAGIHSTGGGANSELTIRNVWIQKHQDGVRLIRPLVTLLENVISDSATRDAFHVEESTGGGTSTTFLRTWARQPGNDCYSIDSLAYSAFVGTACDSPIRYGYRFFTSGTVNPAGISMTGAGAELCGDDCIRVESMFGLHISSGHFVGSSQDGIEIVGGRRITLTGTNFDTNTGYDVNVSSAAPEVVLINTRMGAAGLGGLNDPNDTVIGINAFGLGDIFIAGTNAVNWGANGVVDVTLFRAAANILATDDQFEVRSGANAVFQAQTDADTTFRNFLDQALVINFDSGNTAAQNTDLIFKDRGATKWTISSLSDGRSRWLETASGVNRFLFNASGSSLYFTGSAASNHDFKNSAGTNRVRIHGNEDKISFGSTADISVERTSHPNSVLGFSITPTGRVFGMALFGGDPNTTGWGATEKGVMWFNTTSNNWKGWDGAAVVTLTTSIGTWLSLSDTPGTFTAGAFYNVNTGATALELSPLSEDADSLDSSIDFEAPQVSTTGTAAGEYRMHEPTATGTDYVALGAPASIAANIKFIVPAADGSADQVLKTDGSLGLGFTFVSSANLVAANKTINFSFDLADPVDGDDGLLQHKVGFDFTVVRVSCSTDTGSIPINVDERAEATPNTAGTNALSSDLVCDTNTQTSCASGCDVNTITNGPFDADDPIGLILGVASGSPTVVRVHVEGTID